MQSLTILQMGDVHGHLLSRPNLRGDSTDREEGGLARLYAKVQELRRVNPNTLFVNTGDTIRVQRALAGASHDQADP